MSTKLNTNELFIAISLRLFRGIAERIANKASRLSDDILKSYMSITPEALVSLTLLISLLTIPIAVLGIYIFLEYQIILALSLLSIPALTFFIGLYTPKFSISNRKAALVDELPFFIGYIAILASGGITLPFALERISNNKLLPASSKEARKVFMQIRLLGINPLSALENIARHNPYNSFSDFISGYVITLKSGGDTRSYLLAKLRDAYEYRALRFKSLIESSSNLAETYMSIVVVLGLVLLVIFTSQSLIAGNQAFSLSNDSIIQSMLFSAVLVPVISVAFIGILNNIQPREPFPFYKPYIFFLAFLPFLLIMIFLSSIIEHIPIDRDMLTNLSNAILSLSYFISSISIDQYLDSIRSIPFISSISIDQYISSISMYLESLANYIITFDKSILSSLPLHIRVSIGLIISVLPAAIIELKHSILKNAIESRLPNFLRDLAEVSKHSISIEKALQQLVDRDYGILTKHVNSIAVGLSWGFPMDRILTRFSNATKSWFAKIVAFILLEIVNVGGKIEALNNLADFSERVAQLEKEKRSSLRLYGIIPYIGAIIPVITIIFMLDIFTNTISTGNRLFISEYDKSILLTGSIIQSFATGIVAGKIGEGSASAGFKHALILTVISLISILTAPMLTDAFNI